MSARSHSATSGSASSPSGPAGSGFCLDDLLCFAVYSAEHAFTRAYRPLLKALDVTYPQYLILVLLWRKDGQSVKALGEQLHLDSGTLTPLLKRLEVAGIVRRARNPADERVVNIFLTDAGRALEANAQEVLRAMGSAIGLCEADAVELREKMIALRDRLNAAVE
ncbi:transcriptional regulator [Azorhizobium oxalatiphilum]|uniref:Transcriptional regulator n=1 Tax=Azorhizobium oxalatiphilum TaxID=980631 RepID=A0A917C036_9HYPH|nr:MarR family transcriptional regulator [Azorhizobium oxalatiphilum]GGF65854.1 transcriptional regulator [Azorhizobium oxalatiphilum]